MGQMQALAVVNLLQTGVVIKHEKYMRLTKVLSAVYYTAITCINIVFAVVSEIKNDLECHGSILGNNIFLITCRR